MLVLSFDFFVFFVGVVLLYFFSLSFVFSSCFKIIFLWVFLLELFVFVVFCGFFGGFWFGLGCGDWCMLFVGDFVITFLSFGRFLVEDWIDFVEFFLNRFELRLFLDKSWFNFFGRVDDGNVNFSDFFGEGLILFFKFCKVWWWSLLGGDIMLLVGVCGVENCFLLWWIRF